jgi:hypothetical protein
MRQPGSLTRWTQCGAVIGTFALALLLLAYRPACAGFYEDWFAAINAHDLDKIASMVAPDGTYEDVPYQAVFHGPAELRQHYIADPGDPSHVLGVEKYVSATSANLFGTVLETDFNTVEGGLKSGQLKVQGIISSRSSEGTLTGSYAGKSSVTTDEKTNASRGTYEGTWELTGGTGRFANVRAQGTTKAEINGTQFIGHITGTGTGFDKRASTQ